MSMTKRTKPNKEERRNRWILEEAQKRARDKVAEYLRKHPMGLGSLNEAEFTDAMDAITVAMMLMYSQGMADTLDVLDGRDLPPVK